MRGIGLVGGGEQAIVSRLGWRFVLAVGAATGLFVVGLAQSAGADPGSSSTGHFNIVQQWGTPIGTPTNNSNCTGPIGDAVTNDYVFIDDTGNGIQHQTSNKAGDFWFTSTFTGTGNITFYPASSLTVQFDNQGNIVGTPTIHGPADMVFSGKLTEWFGFEGNKQNAVGHGTVNAQGASVDGGATVAAGQPVTFHDQVQFRWAEGADQSGPPTFFTNNVSC